MVEKVLIVEDEPILQETLAYSLNQKGYQVMVEGDGQAALNTARRFNPDLVILDIMLPGLDGMEVCRILRQETTVPIMMLTALDSEIDRVVSLETGADDFLSKPFSMRELLARVKALLRRVRLEQAENPPASLAAQSGVLKFDDLRIDKGRRETTLAGTPLSLKPREYELLLFFAQNPGVVLSRKQILDEVWGWNFQGSSRTIDVHIRWLREKIEINPTQPERFITVRGAGYRFDG